MIDGDAEDTQQWKKGNVLVDLEYRSSMGREPRFNFEISNVDW